MLKTKRKDRIKTVLIFALSLILIANCFAQTNTSSSVKIVYGWCGDGLCNGAETGANCAADCVINNTIYVNVTINNTVTVTETITVSKGRGVVNVFTPPEQIIPEVLAPEIVQKKVPPKILVAPTFEKPAYEAAGFLKIPVSTRTLIIFGLLLAAFLAGMLLNVRQMVINGIEDELIVRNTTWPVSKEVTEIFVKAKLSRAPKKTSIIFNGKSIEFKKFTGNPKQFFREALISGPLMIFKDNKAIFAVKNKNRDFIGLFRNDELKIKCEGINKHNSEIYYIHKKHNFDSEMQKKIWSVLEPSGESDVKIYFRKLLASARTANLKSADDFREYVNNITSILQ